MKGLAAVQQVTVDGREAYWVEQGGHGNAGWKPLTTSDRVQRDAAGFTHELQREPFPI